MKKLFCILLSILMLTTVVLAFNSCTPDEQGDQGSTPAETKTPTPEGYRVYTKGSLSFAIPSDWTEDTEDLIMDPSNNGNNITIVAEAKNDSHYQMTVDIFNSQYKPAMEAAGLSISNVNVEQTKNNNGINITKASFNTSYMGVSMKQTQFVVTLGDKTYTVTVTERVSNEALVENVFQTIDKVG